MKKFTFLSLTLLLSAFMICVDAQVTGTVVNTQNLSIEVVPNTSYAIDSVEFDLTTTLTDLGVTSISEATVIGFNEDGSYADGYTADNGFWTARSGYVSTWGGGGVAFTAYGVLSDNQIGVGQFPDSLQVGETAKTIIGFLANDKIEKLEIDISVVAALPITATVVDTQSIAITVPQRTDYATDPLSFDVAQALSDLGISAMSEIEAVVTYDTEGSLTDVTATGNVFWYDLDANYGSWGPNASVFVNYESTDFSYVLIGQYPDNVDSMFTYTYTVYYGFMANDKIEMLEIAVTIREPEITQNLSIEVVPNTSYAIDSVEFDLSKTLADLGIASISEATVIGFNEDGSYVEGYNADDGYWTARNGYVSNWGAGGVAFTAYGVLSENQIGVGQFPDSLKVGETAKAMIGFLANDTIEKLEITISVVAALPITATVVDTQSIAITVPQRTDYATDQLPFDVAQALSDLGISAMSEIEAVVTYDTEGSLTDVTATGNVFWYDLDAKYGSWGPNASVFVNYESTDSGSVLIGQYPDNVDSMFTYTYTVYYGFMANDKIEMLEIAVTIREPEITQNLSIEVVPNTSYAIDSVEFDLSKTLTDLGITSISEATVIGFNEDGSYVDGYNADNGFWTARKGYVSNWGAGGVAFTAYGVLSENQIGVGQFPDSLKVGETAKTIIGFLANDTIEKLEITISVVAALPITATVVETQSIAITVPQRTDYATDQLQFDVAQTLSDLGISAMSEIEAVVTYDTEGSLTDVTATGNVFWYDLDAKYGSWGTNASVFVNYESTDFGYVLIGQFPDNVDTMLSETYTVYYGFMANDKIEMLEIAVTIKEATGINLTDGARPGLMTFNNQVRDDLRIVFTNPSIRGAISIYNLNGAKLMTIHTAGSAIETVNLAPLANGIYFLHYSNGSTSEIVKFIKQ